MARDSATLKITYNKISELNDISRKIIDFAKDQKIWLFQGELGSGKTTLIQSVCKNLGVTDYVTSPTFTIINEYQDKKGEPVYHFDFYRLTDVKEVLRIGVEDYFDTGNYCFIEWPEVGEQLLPDQKLIVNISVNRDHIRTIELNNHG